MSNYDHILAKSADKGSTTLKSHLEQVAMLAVVMARNMGLDENIAYKGAIIHDIGKACPEFQKRLKPGYKYTGCSVFRHEIASLFFLSLFEGEEKELITDMIVAHHKSTIDDVSKLGLLDLDEYEDSFKTHSVGFEDWKEDALGILEELGIKTKALTLKDAESSYEFAIDHCIGKRANLSMWKGLLMGADHLASAMGERSNNIKDDLYITPDLSFYNRTHRLFPLSEIDSNDTRRHTIVKAPTGAGKTDFLLRRCQGRVFYTLPFQASINAMYERIKKDLDGTKAQVYLLHSSSQLKLIEGRIEERIMQRHPGASVKVLTPHQMASIAFGIKGFEAMALDLKGCDIILDEIHTYSDTTQAIVLKIIEILVWLDCRVHIGTATMPSILYDKILAILGGKDKVYEVALDDITLEKFDRHIVHKSSGFESLYPIITDSIREDKKVLIVVNRVKDSQTLYQELRELYPSTKMMLIHSRFKREHRVRLESELKNIYNNLNEGCIVISTQVVEVSLDISFDVMITSCAPIDAMIQRFGRIHRKRSDKTIGTYKPIYVLPPPNEEMEAKPYSLEVLQKSYDVLPDSNLLKEKDVQTMMDQVYTDIKFENIDFSGSIFKDGRWVLKELAHKPKSTLLDTLDIDAATCIVENDKDDYSSKDSIEASKLEIPISYNSIGYRHLEQSKAGSRPYIIPDKSYDEELGLLLEYAKTEFYNTFEMI